MSLLLAASKVLHSSHVFLKRAKTISVLISSSTAAVWEGSDAVGKGGMLRRLLRCRAEVAVGEQNQCCSELWCAAWPF